MSKGRVFFDLKSPIRQCPTTVPDGHHYRDDRGGMVGSPRMIENPLADKAKFLRTIQFGRKIHQIWRLWEIALRD